jgi:hypothetical protein
MARWKCRVPMGDIHCILQFRYLGGKRMILHSGEYGHDGLFQLCPNTDGLKATVEISFPFSHYSRVFNSMNEASQDRRARS